MHPQKCEHRACAVSGIKQSAVTSHHPSTVPEERPNGRRAEREPDHRVRRARLQHQAHRRVPRQPGAALGWVRTGADVVAQDDGDKIYVFGSFAGGPKNPAWYHNLVADPDITVEVGPETFDGTAVVLDG